MKDIQEVNTLYNYLSFLVCGSVRVLRDLDLQSTHFSHERILTIDCNIYMTQMIGLNQLNGLN